MQKGAFCGLRNTPKCVFGRGPVGGAHDAPIPLSGLGEDTPIRILPQLGPSIFCFQRFPLGADRFREGIFLGGRNASKCVTLEPRLAMA